MRAGSGRPGSLSARLRLSRGVRYAASAHRVGLLLVDGRGQPLGLDYTAQATTSDRFGNLSTVTLAIPAGTALPRHLRCYVIADVFPLASRQMP